MSRDKWDVILGFYESVSRASAVVLLVMIAAAMVHSYLSSRNVSSRENLLTPKAIFVCSAHVLIAVGVYWHLVSGGWLTQNYQWDDPNIVNLNLAVLEALAMGSVIAFGIRPRPFTYRFVLDLLVIQLVVGLSILIWFLIVMGSLGRSKRLF